MNNPETGSTEQIEEIIELQFRTPVRRPSATKAPLNNTAALLGPDLNRIRVRDLSNLARLAAQLPPDLPVS